MKLSTRISSVALVVTFGVGCATAEENEQALAAALGAVVGGGICALAGGNTVACLASAAGGAFAGWGVVKAKQVMDRRTDLPQKASKPSVVITDYQLEPSSVVPGQAVTATTTYDLLTPQSRPVTQTFKIETADGKEVATFTPMKEQFKEQGRYEVGYEIPIPKKAPAGQYRLVQQLDAQTASPEVRTASFDVVKKVAWLE